MNKKVIVKSDDKTRTRKEIIRNAQVTVKPSKVAVSGKTLNLDVKQVRSDLPSKTNRKSGEKPQPKPEGIKNVNIPLNEKKYKGLVDLRGLGGALVNPALDPTKGSKTQGCLPTRDPVPCLQDYFTPKFDNEYVFTFPQPGVSLTTEWRNNPTQLPHILDDIHRVVKDNS